MSDRRFYPLSIKDIRRETEDCVSIAFSVPEDLRETFRYQHGQYLTLRKELAGEEVRRSYSICSSPLDEELRIAVKRVSGGRFSTFVNELLRPGETLEVMPPDGRFTTTLERERAKQYVAFAAGSGITPVFSILRTMLLGEPDSRFILFYGNRRQDSIIFREQLEALKSEFLDRFSLHYVLSREHPGSDLFAGRIDREKCDRFCDYFFDPESVDDYFLCGPESMILAVRECLLAHGVERRRIHLELFGTEHKSSSPAPRTDVETATPRAVVSITLDGKTRQLPLLDQETILEAALRAGANLPYACMGGVCCTCRAKLEAGEVRMDVNYALEEDELAAGYILTCQSRPVTPELAVNFDE